MFVLLDDFRIVGTAIKVGLVPPTERSRRMLIRNTGLRIVTLIKGVSYGDMRLVLRLYECTYYVLQEAWSQTV